MSNYKCSYGNKNCECKTDEEKSTCDLAFETKTKMSKEEEYWEQRGYDDKCWGYPVLDHVWDEDKKYPKKYQQSYRLGQWRAYEEGKSFKNEKPYFDKPKQIR